MILQVRIVTRGAQQPNRRATLSDRIVARGVMSALQTANFIAQVGGEVRGMGG